VTETIRVAMCQVTTGPNPAENAELVADWTGRAAAQGARVVVFPEATMAHFGVSLGGLAEPLDGPWASRVAEVAREHGVLVVAGMFTPEPDGRVRNTLLATGPGTHVGYDKIHLYDAFGFLESDTVAPGDKPVTVDVDGVTLGLATCYDIRFPELFRRLADDGAQAVLLSASWGAGPGKREQWELLARARALDSTSWVLACGQADPAAAGVSVNPKAPTGIGYSLAADPHGRVTGSLAAEPGLLLVDVDLELVGQARQSIPVLANRRM
jgi:deaminated glutathione amidase